MAVLLQDKAARVRQEVVHALAVGDAGHADLNRCIPSDDAQCEQLLDQVGVQGPAAGQHVNVCMELAGLCNGKVLPCTLKCDFALRS